MADRTARAHVQALIGKGVLSTTRRRRGPPFYQIDYEWKASKAPAKRTQDRPATGQSKRDAKTGQFARSKTGRPPATEREGTNLPLKIGFLNQAAPKVVDAASRCASQAAPLDAAHVEDEQKQPDREPFQTFGIHAVPADMDRDLDARAAHITGKSRPSFAAPVLAESAPEPEPDEPPPKVDTTEVLAAVAKSPRVQAAPASIDTRGETRGGHHFEGGAFPWGHRKNLLARRAVRTAKGGDQWLDVRAASILSPSRNGGARPSATATMSRQRNR